MLRKLGREKKPAFNNFYRDLGVNPFFASEVGGERRDQLSKARHPPLGGSVLARSAFL